MSTNEFHIGHGFGGFSTECPACASSGEVAEIARLRAAIERLRRADHVVHSAYDGECEHGFGPPATRCPNEGCPDRELAEAWAALTA